MSLVPYKITALPRLDPTGLNVIPYASVSVLNRGTGTFSTLKTDSSGATPLSNPFLCDVNGEREFWVAGGNYSISVSGGQSWDISINGESDITFINTFVDLGVTPSSSSGVIVYLKEHTSGGVGGDYFQDFSGTIVNDGGTQINNTASPGRHWKRISYSRVNPEMFGAGPAISVSDDAPVRAALLHAMPCDLSRIYSIASVIALAEGKIVIGINKKTTGLFAQAGFSIPAAASSMLSVFSYCNLQNFRVDANNQNGGAAKRLNSVSIDGSAKYFHISDVDVYNCTGYGHVTFGSESNPQVVGYYESCFAYNCQVSFEQIGALDVTLVKCVAEGVSGRALELFHPYAGSKNVTYISCRAYGSSGAGVNIITTNGYPLGPIRLIDCDINVLGSVSAVNVEKVSGADTTVDLQIIGGHYKTEFGSALNLNTTGVFKFLAGAKFTGGEACNMPPFTTAFAEFSGCDLLTTKASNTQQAIALIKNSAVVSVTGGKITAVNAGTGGALAISGAIAASSQSILTPPSPSGVVFIAEAAGVATLQADGANGFFNILTPINVSNIDKIVLTYSARNTSDLYPPASIMSWWLLDPTTVRVRISGWNNVSVKLSYSLKVLA